MLSLVRSSDFTRKGEPPLRLWSQGETPNNAQCYFIFPATCISSPFTKFFSHHSSCPSFSLNHLPFISYYINNSTLYFLCTNSATVPLYPGCLGDLQSEDDNTHRPHVSRQSGCFTTDELRSWRSEIKMLSIFVFLTAFFFS